MKLYELSKRKIWVRTVSEETGPPDGIKPIKGDKYFFDHIDGMYSYCRDKQGNVVHLPAWTEVEIMP